MEAHGWPGGQLTCTGVPSGSRERPRNDAKRPRCMRTETRSSWIRSGRRRRSEDRPLLPCQGGGRGFESRRPLQVRGGVAPNHTDGTRRWCVNGPSRARLTHGAARTRDRGRPSPSGARAAASSRGPLPDETRRQRSWPHRRGRRPWQPARRWCGRLVRGCAALAATR